VPAIFYLIQNCVAGYKKSATSGIYGGKSNDFFVRSKNTQLTTLQIVEADREMMEDYHIELIQMLKTPRDVGSISAENDIIRPQ
jgi:hypothetical protein